MAGVRLVLDTQVWLDWLVFDDPSAAAIREAQAAGRVEIVIDDACEAELVRVLGYDLGRFSLEPSEQTECIARCRRVARAVVPAAVAGLPKCRDPDDQKFLELAAGAGARVLVSKDQAVLALAPRVAQFRILAPEDFLIVAYLSAEYVVFGEPELVLRIGEPNEALDALLEAEGAETAAYVTAANPRGRLAGKTENVLAATALLEAQREAGFACFAGEGRDPQGEWPAEPSVLVIGIPRTEAEVLGRGHEQNAIVFIEKGGAPELVLLNDAQAG